MSDEVGKGYAAAIGSVFGTTVGVVIVFGIIACCIVSIVGAIVLATVSEANRICEDLGLALLPVAVVIALRLRRRATDRTGSL